MILVKKTEMEKNKSRNSEITRNTKSDSFCS